MLPCLLSYLATANICPKIVMVQFFVVYFATLSNLSLLSIILAINKLPHVLLWQIRNIELWYYRNNSKHGLGNHLSLWTWVEQTPGTLLLFYKKRWRSVQIVDMEHMAMCEMTSKSPVALILYATRWSYLYTEIAQGLGTDNRESFLTLKRG